MTMNTGPRSYAANLPSGELITRTTRSARLYYTHVRLIEHPRGRIISWHTSHDLAANGRVDVAEWRNFPWTVVEARQTAGEGATPAPAAPVSLGHGSMVGTEWLATVGRGRAVHISLNRDGDRNTACDARPDRRGVSPVYDRTAVVTCKSCLKAHAAR